MKNTDFSVLVMQCSLNKRQSVMQKIRINKRKGKEYV